MTRDQQIAHYISMARLLEGTSERRWRKAAEKYVDRINAMRGDYPLSPKIKLPIAQST